GSWDRSSDRRNARVRESPANRRAPRRAPRGRRCNSGTPRPEWPELPASPASRGRSSYWRSFELDTLASWESRFQPGFSSQPLWPARVGTPTFGPVTFSTEQGLSTAGLMGTEGVRLSSAKLIDHLSCRADRERTPDAVGKGGFRVQSQFAV